MIPRMSHFSEKLNAFLSGLKWTAYKMADASGMNTQYVYKLTTGQRIPEDETLERIAVIPEFQNGGVTLEVLKSWRAVDRAEEIERKYDPETILKAYEILIQKDPEKYWPEVLEIEKRIKGKKNKK